MKVKQSLEGVDGVKTCNVDFDSKTATVTYDNEKISREKISNIIAKGTYYKVKDAKKKSWSLFGWLFGKS
jgi:copper chaperone CopZ